MNTKPFQAIVKIVFYLAIVIFACLMYAMTCEPSSEFGDYTPFIIPTVIVIFVSFYLKE